jgi:Domain of unknown function (DUF4303)
VLGRSGMDGEALRKWLREPRRALIAAVAAGVRDHVAALRARGTEFYGYALLPGEPYEVTDLVAATNSEADVKVPPSDPLYRYYRYSVDEWAHYEPGRFAAAADLLAADHRDFRAMHGKADGDEHMDEFEVAHARVLLDAVAGGLEAARDGGVFGGETFLAVWISDSGHPIIAESVRRLNPAAVAQQFMAEFG